MVRTNLGSIRSSTGRMSGSGSPRQLPSKMQDKKIGAQISRFPSYDHIAGLSVTFPRCIREYSQRGIEIGTLRELFETMATGRVLVKLFLVDQHGAETYQMSTLVPWNECGSNFRFLNSAVNSFGHPDLQSAHEKQLNGVDKCYSLKCAVRDEGCIVWARVGSWNWGAVTPQDTLGIFLPYTREDTQDGHEAEHIAKDLGGGAKKRPRLASITCDGDATTGADGILIPFPETYRELQKSAWSSFGPFAGKSIEKTQLSTVVVDPTGRSSWVVFTDSVYEDLADICSTDLLHVKVSFS